RSSRSLGALCEHAQEGRRRTRSARNARSSGQKRRSPLGSLLGGFCLPTLAPCWRREKNGSPFVAATPTWNREHGGSDEPTCWREHKRSPWLAPGTFAGGPGRGPTRDVWGARVAGRGVAGQPGPAQRRPSCRHAGVPEIVPFHKREEHAYLRNAPERPCRTRAFNVEPLRPRMLIDP